MNSAALPIDHAPILDNTPVKQNPAIEKTKEIFFSLAKGAMAGYAIHWIVRGCVHYGIGLNLLGEVAKKAVLPGPYIQLGVTYQAIFIAAQLTYEAALLILGERAKYETLSPSEEHSAFDRLRHRSWKVIGHIEEIPHKIDKIYSRQFGILTTRQVQEQEIEKTRDLFISEAVRQSFVNAVKMIFTSIIPRELAVYSVSLSGFLVPGHFTFWKNCAIFLIGIVGNTSMYYNKRNTERLQAALNEQERIAKEQAGQQLEQQQALFNFPEAAD